MHYKMAQKHESWSNARRKLHEIIFEADTPSGKLFDIILMIAIIGSVLVVMLDSVKSLNTSYGSVFFIFEWIFTLLFTIEYILRLISVGRPLKYAASFFGVVDLLAVIPTYLAVIFSGVHYFMIIRILRLLRIFRVLKLLAYLSEAQMLLTALKASRKKIIVFLFTVPGGHYPHGLLLSKFDSLKLPDDADDTALIYLTKKQSKEDILWLKDKLAFHANLQRGRKVKKTLPQYENLKAYSTWFGSDRVYVDFDISVMCNIMRFVFENDLPLNAHDYDTMKFIETVIMNDEHLDYTFIVAPWYPNVNIILYHVSRLLSPFDKPEYAALKNKVISDLHKQILKAESFMDYTILSTSLLRLNVPVADNPFPLPTERELGNFSWGVTPILYTVDWFYNMKNEYIKKLVASKPLNYQFRSIAHCLALILENLVYRDDANSNND